ncbi:serine hydrolase domain-containing protein [Winogradskyella sp.]|uniref:serine hydrolase domain-containing protein n=1 Tax=Winogradskyella sp. TaxID=1883156 RepID=UPI003F6C3B3C
MKLLRFFLLFVCTTAVISCSSDNNSEPDESPSNEGIYFPPLTSDTWDSKSLNELNWDETQLQPLLDYLEVKNSKSFMILHDGKIIVEAYFDGHTNTTPWYWASAGKTLTTAITGIAENEGFLNITDKVSDYIGTGWTSAPIEKENLITCKNLLSMDSGLDDSIGDNVSPANLQYVADAGDRWAYHNVYVKLQDVVASASNQNWSSYFNTKLKDKIGMTGAWIQNGDFSVYWSTTRSMARFGLLVYANGKWENDQIIPSNYLNDAVNTSQNLNEAYGYMWWLNGKNSFKLPQSQIEFNGKLIQDAPSDMYCALGKNDQKVYISPSKKLVIIRMGYSADAENFALSDFDNQLWIKINAIIN